MSHINQSLIRLIDLSTSTFIKFIDYSAKLNSEVNNIEIAAVLVRAHRVLRMIVLIARRSMSLWNGRSFSRLRLVDPINVLGHLAGLLASRRVCVRIRCELISLILVLSQLPHKLSLVMDLRGELVGVVLSLLLILQGRAGVRNVRCVRQISDVAAHSLDRRVRPVAHLHG